MEAHRKLWLKEVVRIGGLYIILLGEKDGEKDTYGKTYDFLMGEGVEKGY